MKTEEINIRDPYLLLDEGMYYLYGTRSATCWGEADGFDCYRSRDAIEWEGPVEIFHRPEGFFADRNYWAPECSRFGDHYYLVTTFGAEDRKKGIYILRADRPDGPFRPYSGRLTPEEWSCIDGTLYQENGHIYLIFSHSFEDSRDGDMCVTELSDDLQKAQGSPELLFPAAEASWAHPVPFAKQEFGIDGDVYFTDGPCVFREGESLYMLWSSWGTNGYAVGAAVSLSGSVKGPWKQQDQPVFPENGGHGMVFRDRDGTLKFMLHYPNDKFREHPVIMEIIITDGTVGLKYTEKKGTEK